MSTKTKDVVDIILQGIYEAHFIQWLRSGKLVFSPTESVYQCKIADAFFAAGYEYVRYEYSIAEFISETGIDVNCFCQKGRLDLFVKRNSDAKTSIVIELKSEFASESALEKDIYRLCDILNCTTEQNDVLTIFAVSLVRSRETDIRDHIQKSFDALEKFVKAKATTRNCQYDKHCKEISDRGKIVWGGCCFVISRANTPGANNRLKASREDRS